MLARSRSVQRLCVCLCAYRQLLNPLHFVVIKDDGDAWQDSSRATFVLSVHPQQQLPTHKTQCGAWASSTEGLSVKFWEQPVSDSKPAAGVTAPLLLQM